MIRNGEVDKSTAGMVPEAPKVTDGGENVPRQDRLYLVDGIIPGTDKNPTDLGLKPYQGIEKKDAQFVDKRQIHNRLKGLLNEIHGDIHADKSFGGIVINQDGQVLLRKPKGEGFGNEWTLAKGGADEGESGSDAALREVLEETGITGKIVEELPGHYNAEDKGNKFYLMEVDTSVDPKPFKGASEGKEETSEIKWVDLDEAMELLEKGKNQEKSDRDVQAVRQGHREWIKRNKRVKMLAAIVKTAKKMSATAEKLHKDLGDHFAENGEFPKDLATNSYYKILLAEISRKTLSPQTGGAHYGMLKGLMGDYLKKIDNKKGFGSTANFSDLNASFANDWGKGAMKVSVQTNMVAHAIADIRGYPESWMFGKTVPPDLDASGRPIFRSDKLRDEMLKLYDEWKAEDYETKISDESVGTGFFSNGEKYDFTKSKPVQYKDVEHGMPVTKTIENHWKLVMGRAMAVKDRKTELGISGRFQSQYKQYGADYLNSQGKDTSKLSQDELIEAGKEFVKDYARTAQNITQSLLKAALPPDVYHLYTVRKAATPREVVGDFGIGGQSLAPEKSLPSAALESSGAAGMPAIVASGALSGASVNPLSYMSGNYAIFRRTNIRDIFMIQSLWNPGYEGERELVIMNNPNSEARVVHQGGKIWKGKTWNIADSRNGIIPRGVMGYEGKRYGVTDPNIDYQTVLKPATAKDNPMVGEHKGGKLGTNAGKLMKNPKTGEQFYLKYSSEDGKNASENLANKLYEAAGIGVPHTELVRYGNGHALKSNWIKDTVHHGTHNGKLNGTPSSELVNRPEIKHGFLVDCVLANWDVVGGGPEKPYGNLMEKDGKIIRIDQGGALQYSGLAGLKGENGSPFWTGEINPQKNEFLDEINNLRDESVNPTTAHVFQGMTEDDWDEASSNLMQLTNSRIEDIVNDSAIQGKEKDKMIYTLKSRRDSALNWWISHPEIVGETGYTSIEDLHNKSNLLKQDLFKAVDAELEAHKNQRILWIDEEGYNERLMRTDEEQAEAEKDFDRTNELMKLV